MTNIRQNPRTPDAADNPNSIAAATSATTVQNLLHEVPRIWDFLHPGSLGSLLTTNRSFRHAVHTFVTTIHIVHKSQHTKAPQAEVAELLMRGSWVRLMHLKLSLSYGWREAKLSKDVMSLLVRLPRLNLRSLDLSRTKLGADAMSVLVKADWPSLTMLDLTGTGLVPAGMRELVAASWMTLQHLQSLNLSNNNLRGEALEMLIDGNWACLTSFSLASNFSKGEELQREAVVYLCRAEIVQLQSLNLAGSWLQTEAVPHLSLALWPQLQHLNLSDTWLSTEGLAQLEITDLHQLRSLDLSKNHFDHQAVEHLQLSLDGELQF